MNTTVRATGEHERFSQIALPRWAVIGILAWLAAGTFGLPLVMGLSWWPSWSTPGFHNPPGMRSPAHPPALDVFTFGTVSWPLRLLASLQIRRSMLPLWDAHSSLGLPLAGRYEPQMFFPLEWLAIFSGPTMWTLLLLLSMLLAALGTYLFLRRVGLGALPALGGAILYMFSGYFIWFYTMPGWITEAWLLPWLFWTIEKSGQGGFGLPRAVGVCGLCIGLMLLGGQPQIAVLNLLGCALYAVLAGALSPNPLRRLAGLIGLSASIPLGVGMAAVQLGLFREALRAGYSLHQPGAYAGTEVHILTLTSAVWPYLLGQLGSPWQPRLSSGSGSERFVQEAFPMVIGTAGLLAVCLAVILLLGAAAGRGKSLRAPSAAAWSLLFVLYLILLLLFPSGVLRVHGHSVLQSEHLIKGLWQHSILTVINFPRYIVPLLSFILATLAAVGVQAIDRLTVRQFVAALVAYLAVTIGLLIPVLTTAATSMTPANASYMWSSIVLSGVPFVVSLVLIAGAVLLVSLKRLPAPRGQMAVLLVLGAEVIGYVRYGLALREEYLRMVPFLAIAACAVLVIANRARIVPAVLLCVPLATAVVIWHAPNGLPSVRSFDEAWEPAYMKMLGQRLDAQHPPGRVLPTYPYLLPDLPGAVGMATLPVNSPVQVDTTAWYILNALTSDTVIPHDFPKYVLPNQWWGMGPEHGGARISWDNYVARRRYYNLIGVRYLVDSPAGWWSQHHAPGVDLVYHDSEAAIYEDRHAFPRAFAVSRVRGVPDLAAARQALLASGTDMRRTAVVETGQTALPTALLDGPDQPAEPVHITTYAPTLATLEVDLDRPALVVLTDAFFPGWSGAVDGRPAEVYRVDAIVRGAVVPLGHHRVTFSYHPHQLSAWLTLSMGSTFLLIGLCVIPRRRSADSPFTSPAGLEPASENFTPDRDQSILVRIRLGRGASPNRRLSTDDKML